MPSNHGDPGWRKFPRLEIKCFADVIAYGVSLIAVY